MSEPQLDPIAVEIHRRGLENIVNEMAITLVRTSGSPTVIDAKDFSTSLLDLQGRQLGIAAYAILHAASAVLAVKALREQLAASGQQTRQGDGWLVNDPHSGGAQHQGDIGLLTPLFHEGAQVGWSFTNLHVADVGGVGVSGFAPGAHSVFEEGMLLPMVHAISGGELLEPWERFVAANVRVANPVLNDIRSMIAANNTAEAKLGELIERVGPELHERYCQRNIDLTEGLLRERIAKLPDGSYEAVDWVEFDGHGPDLALEVRGRMVVQGDSLAFHFAGADQVEAFVNACDGAVHGCLMTALVTMLGFGDMPFNEGMWAPLEIDQGPPGTIVNATAPAPVSAAHAETGHRVIRVTKALLSQALALSADPVLRGRVSGQNAESAPTAGLAGVNQFGGPCVAWYMDPAVGVGGGAQSIMDGQDCYGHTPMGGCGMPDVETHEAADPVVFLWRRLAPNTGGPGLHRGGQGIEQAFYVEGTEQLAGFASAIVAEFPSRGFGGGYPAAASSFAALHETNVHDLLGGGERPDWGNLEGRSEQLGNKVGRLVVKRGDVFVTYSGGGGGLGDPLLRDPELVARDVADGYVTETHAAEAYGVVLDAGGAVDVGETERRRAELVAARIGGEPSAAGRAPASPGVAVELREGGWHCAGCEAQLGDGDDWRSGAVTVAEAPAAERLGQLEMRVRARREAPEALARECFCGACGAALAVEILAAGAEVSAPRLER